MSKMFIMCMIFITYHSCFLGYGLAYESFEKMADGMASKFEAPVIKPAKAKNILSTQSVIVLDAREEPEFSVSHLKSAYHIGYKGFDLKQALELVKKAESVIVYCSVGYRSGDIAQRLRENGVNAYNLWGGIFNWSNQERRLYTSKNKLTKKIHGYNSDWGKWIKKGLVVYE